MLVTCYCCGISRDFKDGEEAFEAGWDAPPYFPQVETCDLCPASFALMGVPESHIKGHERWKIEGRPADFSEALSKGDIE